MPNILLCHLNLIGPLSLTGVLDTIVSTLWFTVIWTFLNPAEPATANNLSLGAFEPPRKMLVSVYGSFCSKKYWRSGSRDKNFVS